MKTIIDLLSDHEACCLLIKAAFSAEFCRQIIASKQQNFKAAKTHYPSSYRNNQRQVVDSEALASTLFHQIKSYIPEKINKSGISKAEEGNWQIHSLNSRIRICRYLPAQYFNKHLDGIHYVSDSIQSKLTFMIYLNGHDEFDGGRTLFFASKTDDSIVQDYLPEQGDLIIFDHNLWHSGETVHQGEKYVLRSDILYRRLDTPTDKQTKAFGEGHLGYIWTATIHNDQLVTSGRDKQIKVWSLDGQKLAAFTGHQNSILSILSFNPDTLISASRDQQIKIWQKSGTDFQARHNLHLHAGSVLCLCKLDELRFLSGGADGIVNCVQADGNFLWRHAAHNEWIWDIGLVDDRHFATISEDGSLAVWALKNQKNLAAYQHDCPLTALAIGDQQMLYIGTFDGQIIQLQFDSEKGKLRQLNANAGHQNIIRRLRVDGQYLYSAGEDNTLKVWKKQSLKRQSSYQHNNFVQDVAVHKDQIFSVSYDGEIRVHPNPKQQIIHKRITKQQ